MKGIWLEKRDSHKEVFIWLDDDLPLGSFLNTVRDILDDLYLPQTPGLPHLDVQLSPRSVADVNNIIFIGFGHFSNHPIRFLKFGDQFGRETSPP